MAEILFSVDTRDGEMQLPRAKTSLFHSIPQNHETTICLRHYIEYLFYQRSPVFVTCVQRGRNIKSDTDI